MEKNENFNPQNLPVLEIEYAENKDGSIFARLEGFHDGNMWAINIETMAQGVAYLMSEILKAERHRAAAKVDTGMFGSGMQATIIDGELVVRWLPIRGFGVTFKSKQNFKDWLAVFLKMAIKAERESSK